MKLLGEKICKLLFVLKGYFVACKLLKTYKGCELLSCYRGVGDRVFLLAFYQEYKKMLNGVPVKIVSCDPSNAIYHMFGVDKKDVIKQTYAEVGALNTFYTTDFGHSFRVRHPNLKSVSADAYLRSDLFAYKQFLDYSTIVKYILDIPQDFIPYGCRHKAISKGLSKKLKACRINLSNTVLMNPFANTCQGIPFHFFQQISDELTKNGIQVITSVVGSQKTLKGSIGLNFGLDDALALADECLAVIGARSGFLDLMSFSKTNIISVDHIDYIHNELFRLENCWKGNTGITTFRWAQRNEKKTVKKIVSLVYSLEKESFEK